MLHRAGLASRGFNGLEPLSWTELKAWSDAARMDITGWEMEVIHELSGVYVRHLTLSEDPQLANPVETLAAIKRANK